MALTSTSIIFLILDEVHLSRGLSFLKMGRLAVPTIQGSQDESWPRRYLIIEPVAAAKRFLNPKVGAIADISNSLFP